MFKVFLSWLTRSAEDAVMQGVGNAAEKLMGNDPQQVPPQFAALVAKLTPTPALPAAETDADAQPEAQPKKRSSGR